MTKSEIQILKKTLGDFELNSYIVHSLNSNKAIIIDVGDGLHFYAKKFFDEKKINLEAILLTHCHIDHIQGLCDLQKIFNAPTYANKLDEYLLEGLSQKAKMFMTKDPGNPHIDRFLQGDETINFEDIAVKIIHTPGHTKGHLTYVIGKDAFVGDCIFAGSIGRTDFPGSSYEDLIFSIRNKIFQLGEDTIIHPGHGPDTTVKAEMMFNPFVGDGC